MKKILVGLSKAFIRVMLFWGLITVFSIMSPVAHKNYIRQYVGSKVVKVTNGRGGGSGFHAQGKSGKTYIITNNHVCLAADKEDYLYIKDASGKKYPKKKVIKRMKKHDLCAIEPLKGISGLSAAKKVYLGESVALVGHPSLRPLSLSMGEVIGMNTIGLMFGRNIPNDKCIGTNMKTSEMKKSIEKSIYELLKIKTLCFVKLKATMLNAISYPGNSGSPVVDIFGRVIGVLFAGSSQPTDAYMVPLPVLREFLKEL